MPFVSQSVLDAKDRQYADLLEKYHALRVAGANPAPAVPEVPRGTNQGTIIEIPDDLLAVANTESEEWARDDTKAMIREKFSVLKDWNKVRRAVGVGEMD